MFYIKYFVEMIKSPYIIHFVLSVLLNNEGEFCHFKRIFSVGHVQLDESVLTCLIVVATSMSAINNSGIVGSRTKLKIIGKLQDKIDTMKFWDEIETWVK